MTSSIHSTVQIRPRTLASRKSRPASVHVTGISVVPPTSNDILSPKTEKVTPTPPTKTSKTEKPKPKNENPAGGSSAPAKAAATGTLARKKVVETKSEVKKTAEAVAKKAEKEKGAFDTGTVRRAKPSDKKKSTEKIVESKKEEVVVVEKEPVVAIAITPEPEPQQQQEQEEPLALNGIHVDVDFEEPKIFNLEAEAENVIAAPTPEPDFVSVIEVKDEGLWKSPSSGEITDSQLEPEQLVTVDVEQEQEPVVALGNPFEVEPEGDTDNTYSIVEKAVEVNTTVVATPLAPEITTTTTSTPDLLEEEDKQERAVTPTPGSGSGATSATNGETSVDGKPKLMTEEAAKAALAEKRRLAREAQEKEALRLEEEARLEEERQRLEAEEAERLVLEARQIEEERLRRAIEEQEKKELEEQK
jgi:hypothetical protein